MPWFWLGANVERYVKCDYHIGGGFPSIANIGFCELRGAFKGMVKLEIAVSCDRYDCEVRD